VDALFAVAVRFSCELHGSKVIVGYSERIINRSLTFEIVLCLTVNQALANRSITMS
jgi:hypothetical protein